MYQFFESIQVNEGLVCNLKEHQDRVSRTLKAFGMLENTIELAEIVKTIAIPKNGLNKLRLSYGLDGKHQNEIIPYQYKNIANFKFVDIKGQRYDFKFENRAWINEALLQSGSAEIMMHDAGFIKDSSYANIVFFDGSQWYTPAEPLLEGTQRAKLLKEGIIQAKAIHMDELDSFHSFKLINAMLDWENAKAYSVSLIAKP
jgi:4-amino-4-deoxychorismate lyase